MFYLSKHASLAVWKTGSHSKKREIESDKFSKYKQFNFQNKVPLSTNVIIFVYIHKQTCTWNWKTECYVIQSKSINHS